VFCPLIGANCGRAIRLNPVPIRVPGSFACEWSFLLLCSLECLQVFNEIRQLSWCAIGTVYVTCVRIAWQVSIK
jgi:hypothetical protein